LYGSLSVLATATVYHVHSMTCSCSAPFSPSSSASSAIHPSIHPYILHSYPIMSISIPDNAQLAYHTVLKGDPKIDWVILYVPPYLPCLSISLPSPALTPLFLTLYPYTDMIHPNLHMSPFYTVNSPRRIKLSKSNPLVAGWMIWKKNSWMGGYNSPLRESRIRM
jgi:hypothetical protein